MPQVQLDYSDNIIEKTDIFNLLKEINFFLSAKLPTELSGCKSRAQAAHVYCLGDGSTPQAFAHIQLKVLQGRSPEILEAVGQGVLDIMKRYFHDSEKNYGLQLSVEVIEIEKTYFKIYYPEEV